MLGFLSGKRERVTLILTKNESEGVEKAEKCREKEYQQRQRERDSGEKKGEDR